MKHEHKHKTWIQYKDMEAQQILKM